MSHLLNASAEIHRAQRAHPVDSIEHRLLAFLDGVIYALHKGRWSDAAYDARMLAKEMPHDAADVATKRAELRAHFEAVAAYDAGKLHTNLTKENA